MKEPPNGPLNNHPRKRRGAIKVVNLVKQYRPQRKKQPAALIKKQGYFTVGE